MLVGALAACGNVGGEKPLDARPPLDATVPAADARAMCEPMGRAIRRCARWVQHGRK